MVNDASDEESWMHEVRRPGLRGSLRHAHTGRVGQKLTAGNGSGRAFESAISEAEWESTVSLAPGSCGLSQKVWLQRLKTDLLDAV